MAERLTEYFECGAYIKKLNIIDVSDKIKFFDNGCVMGKAIDKLAKLEDIKKVSVLIIKIVNGIGYCIMLLKEIKV